MNAKGNIEVHTQNIFPIIKKWLYSDKDIFLRELVVNGCDAITKLNKLKALGESNVEENDFKIKITCNKEEKTITITDNGIGMTEEEVTKYINQVAFSGAEEFLAKYQEKDEQSQIIGQFGLGFYSAFMVAGTVEIDTKSHTDAPAVHWKCEGGTEYELSDSDKSERGTSITLHISSDGEEFLEPHMLRSILLKYCGFLPWEIYLDEDEKPVNDTKPLWTKQPSDCTDEEYKELYHRIFSDMNDPLFWIHLNVEYPFNLKGILYFPKLTHEFESAQGQIKLFNNQVFVAENIKEVTPEFLMLLKGVIDCPELPLNVSRSFLQNDGYVTKISAHITKKVADKLISMQKDERDSFNNYWTDISPFIEYGCMRDEKFYDRLKSILQAKTTDGEYVSLIEYAEKNEKSVTYATDEHQQAQYIKILKESGKTALIMPHVIDTHFITFLEEKEKWKFVRIDTVPEEIVDNEELVTLFKTALGKDDLKITTSSLKTSLPALIVQDEESRRMSDMTRMFGKGFNMPQLYTLVLNTDSKVVQALANVTDESEKNLICSQIYDIARICHAPLSTDEMSNFVERSAELLEKLAK